MDIRSSRARQLRVQGNRRTDARSPRPDAGTDKPVVLVVDDDSDARMIYSIYLRAMGCDVFTGQDGRAAVDKATDLLPDLIVMDLAMPRVDGWEAIRRLRESSWTNSPSVMQRHSRAHRSIRLTSPPQWRRRSSY